MLEGDLHFVGRENPRRSTSNEVILLLYHRGCSINKNFNNYQIYKLMKYTRVNQNFMGICCVKVCLSSKHVYPQKFLTSAIFLRELKFYDVFNNKIINSHERTSKPFLLERDVKCQILNPVNIYLLNWT